MITHFDWCVFTKNKIEMPTASKTDEAKRKSLLDALEENESENQGGSGAADIIGKVLPEMVWKAFTKGLSNADSAFSFDPNDDESKQEAKQSAQERCEEGKRPSTAIQFTIFKSSVKGRDVSQWQGDRVFTYPQWKSDKEKGRLTVYSEVIKPAIVKLAANGKTFDFGEETWMRFSVVPDPTGRMKDNYKFDATLPESETNPRQVRDFVYYPSDIFESEEEAELAASNGNGTSNAEEAVDAFDMMKDDADFIAKVKASAKGKLAKKLDEAMRAIAGEYLYDDAEKIEAVLPKLKELAKK